MIKLIKNINNFIFILIFFLITLKFFNFFYNSYSIVLSDYKKRMTQSYGFCQNESWGFYDHVIERFSLQNQKVNIIHHEKNITLENLFSIKKSSEKNEKYLILLNVQSSNNEKVLDLNIDRIKDYKVRYRINNCYLLELYD
jgi:hypothetical protein